MLPFTLSAASVFLLCTALLCLWLAAHALGQRRHAFTLNFAALMLCSALYALGYGLELASPGRAAMQTMLRLQYLAIPFIPLFWVGLAWAYLDSRGLPRKGLLALGAISGAIFLIYQSNDWHQLYYASFDFVREDGLAIAVTRKGPLYWLNVVYLNLGVGAGVLLFFRAWRQSKPVYHHQALCLLIGSVFPWGFHLVYQCGLSPGGLDLSPFGLAASGLLFSIASFRHGLLDILPMARDMVFDGIAEGVIVLDDRARIVDFNRAAQGFLPELGAQAIGSPVRELHRLPSVDGDLAERAPGEFSLCIDGAMRHVEMRCYPMRNRKGKTISKALLLLDVTEKKALIERLHRMASVDALTGVCSRRHLFDLSGRALQLARRRGSPLAVVLIDVDHFKSINDSQGHPAGDALLRAIAALLGKRLRATDILGRYGGDEFVITLPETDAAQAGRLARELNRSCHAECDATLSIGVVGLSPAMHDFNALLVRADELLYRAKAQGRNRVVVDGEAAVTDEPAP